MAGSGLSIPQESRQINPLFALRPSSLKSRREAEEPGGIFGRRAPAAGKISPGSLAFQGELRYNLACGRKAPLPDGEKWPGDFLGEPSDGKSGFRRDSVRRRHGMTMDILYEAMEYGKVLLGYVLLMLVGPSVVFYKHLQHKPLVYRFGFCAASAPVCLNALILVLGLLHVLSMELTALILAGVFLLSVVRLLRAGRRVPPALCGQAEPVRIEGRPLSRIWNALRGEDAVCAGLWVLTLLFGAVYFTYSAFQVSCYGFGDLYVHHSWIYGLMEGTVYKGGIYPQAMHCFVYCLRALFGISVFSGLRFLQCVHVVVFLLSAGCLLREIFRWRYTPVLTLLLFLTLDVKGADMITSMSRLQWSLPMEFGLPYVFLCALFLIRYVKGTLEAGGACWKNENLLGFFLALTATLSTHYFTVIMAFLVCAPAALCAFRKVFHPKRLLPLLAAAVCGLLIASAPVAWALAGGTPFEASIHWAVSTLSGEKARESQALLESSDVAETETAPEEASGGIYQNGYARLYGKGRGALLLGLSGLSLALCLAGRVRKAGWAKGAGYGYLPMLLMSGVYIVTYAMPYMGLPQLITEGRFSAVGHPLTLASALIPLDIGGTLAGERWGGKPLRRLAVLAAVGIYASVRLSGNYHGFLFYELSRYSSAVTLTREIIEDFQPDTYGIVSTTDELYQIIETGAHIEWLRFLEEVEKEEYRLWTEHLFFYVEKKPLYYAQLYFMEGPSWLGEEIYPAASRVEYETLHPTWRVSQAPDVIASEISPDRAERTITERNDWLKYTRLENREVVESRAYEECLRLMEAYPDRMEVYYEDESFICFHLRQDLENPCGLAVTEDGENRP